MINDILISLKDNIQKRSKNPILGAFTIVYLIHNWELFYSIIYFDSGLNLEQRLQYIRDYYQYHNFWENFFICLGISLGVVALTYFSLAIGRYISSFYASKVERKIFEITENTKIVLKEDYDKIMEAKCKFETKYEKERKEKTEIIEDRDQMEKRYLDMLSAKTNDEVINNLKAEIESIRSQLSAKNMQTESLKKMLEDKDELLLTIQNKYNLEQDDFDNLKNKKLANVLFSDLKANNLLLDFENLVFDANSSKYYWGNPSQVNEKFIKNNIARIEKKPRTNEFKYVITKIGTDVFDLYLKEKMLKD